MVRYILLISVLHAGFLKVHGEVGDTLNLVKYGVEVNQFITGSGFSSGTELLFSVIEGNRSLNIGFYYGNEVRRITGLIAHHEVQLLRNPYRKVIKPFIFYNGIARITKLEDLNDKTAFSTPGIYKTFEHHIGIGFRAWLTRSIYFSSSAGYGIYFGSVKKPINIEGTDEITGSNGFAPIVKLGFGLAL